MIIIFSTQCGIMALSPTTLQDFEQTLDQAKMSLRELRISSDAYFVCLTHALSTESLEVMGLLLGDLDSEDVCRVCSAMVLVRSDKRKDRVEISTPQLLSAAREAERLAAELGRTVRVVGWYHSHPHITVWPSVVDINTQESFQTMDRGFAGVIFSVFPNRQGGERVQAACFQSAREAGGELKRRDIPLRIESTRTLAAHCLKALVRLPETLCEEEVTAFDAVRAATEGDTLTEMHNQAVLVRNTTQTLGLLTLPLVRWFEDRLMHNQRTLQRLLGERDALLARLREGDRDAAESARVCEERTLARVKCESDADAEGGGVEPRRRRAVVKLEPCSGAVVKQEPCSGAVVKQEPGAGAVVKQEPGAGAVQPSAGGATGVPA
ncbi:lys-63-specific deubiquitinase BRCC36-like [Pollicipes pollicipes]|uniref:lys-63-specific deubiquitinase BRCC36-like n=1 Tax=Pollicipes pollicipes TaxID=41117 RepID=UPI0018856025|nr:lys-63-specific deubiquitinase BRCC36-like [Pollicipes pollicipes]